MKRTSSALSLLATLAFTLTACEGHLSPQTPEEESQTTGAGLTSSDATTTGQSSDATAPGSSSATQSTTQSSSAQSSSSPGSSTTPTDLSTSLSSSTSTSEESDSSNTGPIEVPAPYAGQRNPLDAKDTGVIVAGGLRYKKNCGCHVPESKNHTTDAPDLGRGDSAKRPDDWMMWRISEGVAPKMGAFKDTFNETERWQIISYLRALAAKNQKDE